MSAQSIVAAGKSAIEAELSRIETDLATAKAKAVEDAVALATELNTYVKSHATEVAAAKALLGRAEAVGARTVGNALSAAKAWLKAHGWKGYAVLASGGGVLWYLLDRHII